jgi:hypothetical protein
MSSCFARSALLEKNAAGDASVTCAVVTRPVAMPAAFACRPRVASLLPSTSTLTAPLYVFSPVAQAVAAAAESVTGDFGSSGVVVSWPENGSLSIVNCPFRPVRLRRAASRAAGPMPSPLMKMTFFAVGAFAFAEVPGALADAPSVGLSTMVATTAAEAATKGTLHLRALLTRTVTEAPR